MNRLLQLNVVKVEVGNACFAVLSKLRECNELGCSVSDNSWDRVKRIYFRVVVVRHREVSFHQILPEKRAMWDVICITIFLIITG